MVFFGNRSLDDLAFRSYEIYLLSNFAKESQQEYYVHPKIKVNAWIDECDVLLALLVCKFGYGSYR